MCICNDRRWPETYRVLALAGAAVIVVGYNTPDHIPEHPGMDRLVPFHNRLCMQACAHQNGAWVVGVAKGPRLNGKIAQDLVCWHPLHLSYRTISAIVTSGFRVAGGAL